MIALTFIAPTIIASTIISPTLIAPTIIAPTLRMISIIFNRPKCRPMRLKIIILRTNLWSDATIQYQYLSQCLHCLQNKVFHHWSKQRYQFDFETIQRRNGIKIVKCEKNISIHHKVSPPQMPVLSEHLYNANILRADFTSSVPSYTSMWHTIMTIQ